MIQLLTALKCEARPLIEAFNLVRCQGNGPHELYQNGELQLLVSGPGKTAAAAATAFAFASSGLQENTAWLNIGIAGHRQLQPGRWVGYDAGDTRWPAFHRDELGAVQWAERQLYTAYIRHDPSDDGSDWCHHRPDHGHDTRGFPYDVHKVLWPDSPGRVQSFQRAHGYTSLDHWYQLHGCHVGEVRRFCGSRGVA